MESEKLLNQCDGCGAMLFPNNKPTGWAALAVRYRKRAKAWKELAKRLRGRLLDVDHDGCEWCEDCCGCCTNRALKVPFPGQEKSIPFRGKR